MPTQPTNAKNKGNHHKTPPAPPALGIAERNGDGYKFVIVLGGLRVNGKSIKPQDGAEYLAEMLDGWMKRTTPAASKPTPETAVEDLEAAAALAESSDVDPHATNGDERSDPAESSDAPAPADVVVAPGENGHR